MPENAELRPATGDDIEEVLAFALRFDGRKRMHQGDEFMARITAERLVALVMKKPPLAPPTIPKVRRDESS